MKHFTEFLNDVITNESLKKELGECVAKADTSDAKVKLMVQFAMEAGYDVTEEELAMIVEKATVNTELSDDELDMVAGGFEFDTNAIPNDYRVAQIVTATGNGPGSGISSGMGIDEFEFINQVNQLMLWLSTHQQQSGVLPI